MEKILTIIVPTYNMERYLDKCLSSLIVSDEDLMRQLEVLVVNDGSKDRSSEIAHSYAERYPETYIVIDKENGNYGSCINAALPVAKGKYVKVLDADDFFDNSFFVEYLLDLKFVDVDLVLNKCKIVNQNDASMRDNVIVSGFIPQTKYTFDNCVKNLSRSVSMHNIAYKRSIFDQLKYRQTEGVSYTDTEWIFTPMCNVKSVYFIDVFLYKYLLGREGQTMQDDFIQRNRNDQLTVAQSIIKEYHLRNVSVSHAIYLRDKIRFFFLWMLFSTRGFYDIEFRKKVDLLLNSLQFDTVLMKDISDYIQLAKSQWFYLLRILLTRGYNRASSLFDFATYYHLLKPLILVKVVSKCRLLFVLDCRI